MFDANPISRRLRLFLFALLVGAGAQSPALADPLNDYFHAVQFDDVDTLKSMLAGPISPNLHDVGRGETGLIVAVREGAMKSFALLLSQPGIELEATANNGNTALMMAAFKGNLVAARALLAKGAAVNRAGWTPLHYAAAGGADDVVELLLAHGAKLEALAPSDLTPLMMAAREGRESTVTLLLSKGARLDARNGEGHDAAQLAARYDHPGIAAMLKAYAAGKK